MDKKFYVGVSVACAILMIIGISLSACGSPPPSNPTADNPNETIMVKYFRDPRTNVCWGQPEIIVSGNDSNFGVECTPAVMEMIYGKSQPMVPSR